MRIPGQNARWLWLLAGAIMAMLSLPGVTLGQSLRNGAALADGGSLNGVALTGGTAPGLNGATLTVSGGGATYLVQEDFEETGIPSANTWSVVSGTINWDATSHSHLTGEALYLDANGENVNVTFSSGGTFWAAMKMEWDFAGVGSTSLFVRLRTNTPSTMIGLGGSGAGDRATCYINGATSHTSSTFAFSNGTLYYVWLRYEPNGTCGVYISTSSTRPTAPTDTASAYAHEETDTANGAVDALWLFAQTSANPTAYFDEIYVDDAEIGTPW